MLNKVRTFIKVVELNSFSEAALELDVSESAVSQAIKSLEKEIGVPLFVKKGRSFTLTVAGTYFYANVPTIISELDRLLDYTKKLNDDYESKFTIGYLLSYDNEKIAKAVMAFSSLYDDVNVSLVSANHEGLYDLLVSDDANIVISDQRRAFSDEYENLELERLSYYVELPSGHPFSFKDHVDIEELIYTPLIVVATKDQEKAEEEYFRSTLRIASPIIFAQNKEIASLMAKSGKGYTLCLGKGEESLELRRDGKPITFTLCAFWKKKRSFFYTNEFAKCLKEQFIR